MGSYVATAGPLAWPVIVLGVVAATAAAAHAFRASERSAAVARSAILGSLILGLLNTLLGWQQSIAWTRGTGTPELRNVLRWLGDSLNGLVLALAFALLVVVLLLLAGLRRPPASDGAR